MKIQKAELPRQREQLINRLQISGLKAGIILPLRGHLGISEDIFGCHKSRVREGAEGEVLQASNRWRPGMLVQVLYFGTAHPAKNYSAPNVTSIKRGKCYLKLGTIWSIKGVERRSGSGKQRERDE